VFQFCFLVFGGESAAEEVGCLPAVEKKLKWDEFLSVGVWKWRGEVLVQSCS
jgi:hypothetical protein